MAAVNATSHAPRRNDGLAARTHAAILEATIAVVARHSLSGTTVQLVAEAASVAPGTVILHFKSKDALLAEAMEHVALEFETARRRALEVAFGDPVKALTGLIDVAFDPAVGSAERVAVWYAFWGEAGARRLYMLRFGALDNEYQAGIVRSIAELIARNAARLDAEAVAIGFAGLLEWQWQGILTEGAAFDRQAARRVALNYLAGLFPQDFPMTEPMTAPIADRPARV